LCGASPRAAHARSMAALELDLMVSRYNRPIPAVDPDWTQLMEFTGLYVVYLNAIPHEMWLLCALNAYGRVRVAGVKYVPGPIAMMVLQAVSDCLDIEVDVDDVKGKANIIYKIPVLQMTDIARLCSFRGERFGFRQYRLQGVHGALLFVAGFRLVFVEGRGCGTGRKSAMEFLSIVWKAQPNGDLRPGTNVNVTVAKYLSVQAHVKDTILAWPRPEDLAPGMIAWAALPLVNPVTRAPPANWRGSVGPVDFGVDPEAAEVAAKRKRKRDGLLKAMLSKAASERAEEARAEVSDSE
jgi:hypothetical protein